jgi:hypothetical protein
MVKPNFFIIFLSCAAGCRHGSTPLAIPSDTLIKNGTLFTISYS